jgi:hypothetical protein
MLTLFRLGHGVLIKEATTESHQNALGRAIGALAARL